MKSAEISRKTRNIHFQEVALDQNLLYHSYSLIMDVEVIWSQKKRWDGLSCLWALDGIAYEGAAVGLDHKLYSTARV